MELPDEVAMEKLQQATDMFKEDIGRVDFTELWRPFTTIEGGLVPSGGPMTKLAKLRHALGAHLPSGQHQAAEELLDTCAKGIERCWRLDLGYGCHK